MPLDSPHVHTQNDDRSTLEELPVEGRLEAVAFLGARSMLVVVSGRDIPERAAVKGLLLTDDRVQRLAGARISLSCDELATVLLMHPAGRNESLATGGSLLFEAPGGAVALEPPEIAQATVGVAELGSEWLTGLDPKARAALLDQILLRIGRRAGGLADAAESLSRLRDAIRERLPIAETHLSAAYAAEVDAIWRVDDSSFYVEGWMLDRRAAVTKLQLVSPEGRRVDILGHAFRYPRHDVAQFFGMPGTEKFGFIAHLWLPEASPLSTGWVLQARLSDGTSFETVLPPVIDHPLNLRATILADLDLDPHSGHELIRSHISPALTRLQARLTESATIDTVDQHGIPPREPETTIIVPLYRRIEFLEHQLAEFVHDPDICDADIIYVLDSPEDAARLRPLAGHLFDLYRIPFRLVVLSANGGYSVVNNLGASLARGRMLLLLNSDVLPSAPGWLSRMVRFHDANPMIGALAPKLLYEDDSIQHAGLYFERPARAGAWANEHFYKGLHGSFPAANVARAVPAVTGACLLIATEEFRSLGGLRGSYVRGDYEDSDLCLRLREHDRETWYLPEVELYHLEGQSYASEERTRASQYNQWLHTQLWRETLLELEERPG